jgi:hypothetical protein
MQEEVVMPAWSGANPVHLKPREVLDIHDGEGLVVKSLRGVLWITQSNDTDDIVIGAGETFVLDRGGLALISAPIGPADIVVSSKSDHAQKSTGEPATARSHAA